MLFKLLFMRTTLKKFFTDMGGCAIMGNINDSTPAEIKPRRMKAYWLLQLIVRFLEMYVSIISTWLDIQKC